MPGERLDHRPIRRQAQLDSHHGLLPRYASDSLVVSPSRPGRQKDKGRTAPALVTSGVVRTAATDSVFDGLTASQVDPAFLSEIPEQLRAELLRDLTVAEAARQQQRQKAGGVRAAVLVNAGNGQRALDSEYKCIKEPHQTVANASPSFEVPLFTNGHEPASVRKAFSIGLEALITCGDTCTSGAGERYTATGFADETKPLAMPAFSQSTTLPPLPQEATVLIRSYMHWLLSLDDRLDELSRGLKLLEGIAQKAHEARDMSIATGCRSAFEEVQNNIESNFGFRLSWR